MLGINSSCFFHDGHSVEGTGWRMRRVGRVHPVSWKSSVYSQTVKAYIMLNLQLLVVELGRSYICSRSAVLEIIPLCSNSSFQSGSCWNINLGINTSLQLYNFRSFWWLLPFSSLVRLTQNEVSYLLIIYLFLKPYTKADKLFKNK